MSMLAFGKPRLLIACLLSLLAAVAGCGRSPRHRSVAGQLAMEPIESPVPSGGIVPQLLQTSSGDIVLSWLEPMPVKGYTFRMAIQRGNRWSDPRTISSGEDISMFQADLPGVAEIEDGSLVAYWQVSDKANGDPYATTIQVASSKDDGLTWTAPRTPYQKAHPGQHGFISAFPLGEHVGLVWLDAEQQRYFPAKKGRSEDWKGAIGLRYASLDRHGRSKAESFVDPITCECCPTAAAVTSRGPVVVFRGRQEPQGANPAETDVYKPTVRDIQISRLENGKWTRPHSVFDDNWVINACPDNGPAVDAAGERVVVAWWTAAGNQPSVKVAFSLNAGDTFSPPVRVDNGAGAGQVTVALTADQSGAVVGWLEGNKVWARWVSQAGSPGEPLLLGPAAGRRLPRWVARTGEVVAAWANQNDNEQRSVAVAHLKVGAM